MKMPVIAAVLGMALLPSLALGQDRVGEKTSEKVRAVRFGKLWDGKGKTWSNAIVIIDGDRVREVTTDSRRIPSGAEGMRLESVVTSRTRSPSMITIALDQVLPLPSHNFPNRTALTFSEVFSPTRS